MTGAAIAAGVASVAAAGISAGVNASSQNAASSRARKIAKEAQEATTKILGQTTNQANQTLQGIIGVANSAYAPYRATGLMANTLINWLINPTAGASFSPTYLPEVDVTKMSKRDKKAYLSLVDSITQNSDSGMPTPSQYTTRQTVYDDKGGASTANVVDWASYQQAVREWNSQQRMLDNLNASSTGYATNSDLQKYTPTSDWNVDLGTINWTVGGEEWSTQNASTIDSVRQAYLSLGDTTGLATFNALIAHPRRNMAQIDQAIAEVEQKYKETQARASEYQESVNTAKQSAADSGENSNPMQVGPGYFLHNFDWNDFQNFTGYTGTMGDLFKSGTGLQGMDMSAAGMPNDTSNINPVTGQPYQTAPTEQAAPGSLGKVDPEKDKNKVPLVM